MVNRDDAIDEGFDLISSLVKKREPEVTGEVPSVQELEARFNEIYGTKSPAESSPEIENEGIELEKEKEGLSQGSQSVAEGTACIPCSNDHVSTCAGLLAEALRFARKDGIESPEVISRIGLCRDELNALERVDLRPEMTSQLPDWERKLANDVLNSSRQLRHNMAEILSVDDLEKVAGDAQRIRREIGEQWLKGRIAAMSAEEKAKVKQKATEILNQEVGGH